jgi:hypothetical protein
MTPMAHRHDPKLTNRDLLWIIVAAIGAVAFVWALTVVGVLAFGS